MSGDQSVLCFTGEVLHKPLSTEYSMKLKLIDKETTYDELGTRVDTITKAEWQAVNVNRLYEISPYFRSRLDEYAFPVTSPSTSTKFEFDPQNRCILLTGFCRYQKDGFPTVTNKEEDTFEVLMDYILHDHLRKHVCLEFNVTLIQMLAMSRNLVIPSLTKHVLKILQNDVYYVCGDTDFVNHMNNMREEYESLLRGTELGEQVRQLIAKYWVNGVLA